MLLLFFLNVDFLTLHWDLLSIIVSQQVIWFLCCELPVMTSVVSYSISTIAIKKITALKKRKKCVAYDPTIQIVVRQIVSYMDRIYACAITHVFFHQHCFCAIILISFQKMALYDCTYVINLKLKKYTIHLKMLFYWSCYLHREIETWHMHADSIG